MCFVMERALEKGSKKIGIQIFTERGFKFSANMKAYTLLHRYTPDTTFTMRPLNHHYSTLEIVGDQIMSSMCDNLNLEGPTAGRLIFHQKTWDKPRRLTGITEVTIRGVIPENEQGTGITLIAVRCWDTHVLFARLATLCTMLTNNKLLPDNVGISYDLCNNVNKNLCL